MKNLITMAIVLTTLPAIATPHHHAPQATSTSNANSDIEVKNNTTYNSIPNVVGPVPRGFVPVLSVYGQMDYQQRGTYGAQISIPLAR